jgi:hypothetical protein
VHRLGTATKDIKPGDLVWGIDQRFGFVVAVRYARDDTHEGHLGCEERFSVLWALTMHVDDVCDCGLLSTETF